MQRALLPRATLLILLATPSVTLAGGDEYWGYSYRNIDVTAAGTSAYAVNLARYCVRLDAMLTRILGIKTSYRPPTHIYALPAAQREQYVGDSTVSFHVFHYDVTVVTDNDRAADSNYWGAYFGYTAALLAADRQLRGPDWYLEGVPAIFAGTTFQNGRATLGNVQPGYGFTLARGGALIPMRILLTQKKQQVVAGNPNNRRMYDAEVWALAHEVFVESWHRAEFGKYLDLMRQGTTETAAFAASFNISYEQLDKQFADVINRRSYSYTMDAPEDAAASQETAQRLSAAEVKGRLALLTVRYGAGPDALQLANEALQTEPANRTALRALALAQLARGAYSDSLAALDRLAAAGESADAYADSAEVLAALAGAVDSGQATLQIDAATLRQRAKADYQQALAADADDRRSRYGLAKLAESPEEFIATTGIVSHPNQHPLILDIVTNVIPLNPDGTMPRMAVHVRRSRAEPFELSYRVYRRVRGSDTYALTETSPVWSIEKGALIRPDFADGVLLGEYRFAIFIDRHPWRVVEFKVVPNGT